MGQPASLGLPPPPFPPIPAYRAQQSLTCVRSTNLRNSCKDAAGQRKAKTLVSCNAESLQTGKEATDNAAEKSSIHDCEVRRTSNHCVQKRAKINITTVLKTLVFSPCPTRNHVNEGVDGAEVGDLGPNSRQMLRTRRLPVALRRSHQPADAAVQNPRAPKSAATTLDAPPCLHYSSSNSLIRGC